MAKLTNGRVIMEVRDDKAEHYALMTGFQIVHEVQAEEVETPKVAPKRGRPRKAS